MSFYWENIKELTPKEIGDLDPAQQELYMNDPSMWLQDNMPDREKVLNREAMAGTAMLMKGVGAMADAFYSSSIYRDQLAIKESDQALQRKMLTAAHKQDKEARNKKLEDTMAELTSSTRYAKAKMMEARANQRVMQAEMNMQGQSAEDNINQSLKDQQTYLHKMALDLDDLQEMFQQEQYVADVDYAMGMRSASQKDYSVDPFAAIAGKGLLDATDLFYTIKYDLGGTA